MSTGLVPQLPTAQQEVYAQWIQSALGVMLMIWVGIWLLSQMWKAIKGEEVEKPIVF